MSCMASSWQQWPWVMSRERVKRRVSIHCTLPRVIGQNRGEEEQRPKPYTNAREGPVFMHQDLQGPALCFVLSGLSVEYFGRVSCLPERDPAAELFKVGGRSSGS